MQSTAHRALLAAGVKRKLLHHHILPGNIRVGAQSQSGLVTNRGIYHITPCQRIPTHNYMVVRHSSRWSWMSLYVHEKLFGNKLEVVKVSPEHIGDLIHGCDSSKDLLERILPCLQDETLTLPDAVHAIEQLQTLVYKETRKAYPDLPACDVRTMFQNIQLINQTGKVFEELHEDLSFQPLIKFLSTEVENMDNHQFASCLECLWYLNVRDSYSPVLGPFFHRLNESTNDGFDLANILKLHNVCYGLQGSDGILLKSVVPKLHYYLCVSAKSTLDVDGFQALLTLTKSGSVHKYMKHPDLLTIYNMLYKTCCETNYLDDLESASELLSILQRHCSRKTDYNTIERNKLVSDELESQHQCGVIQKMLDICHTSIVAQVKDLTPYHLATLSTAFRSMGTGINSHHMSSLCGLAAQRSLSLLSNHLHELTLPELIWVLSGFIWNDIAGITPETKEMIRIRFESLDAANLCQIYAMINRSVLVNLELFDTIWSNTVECMDQIFEDESQYSAFLKFYSHVRTVSTPPKELDVVLQHKLTDKYETSISKQFHIDYLTHLTRLQQLIPPTFRTVLPIVKNKSLYEKLSNRQLDEIIANALTNTVNIESFSAEEKHIYEEVMNCMLFNSISAYCRTMSADKLDASFFSPHLIDYSTMNHLAAKQIRHRFSVQNTTEAINSAFSNILDCETKTGDKAFTPLLRLQLLYHYEVERDTEIDEIFIKMQKESTKSHRNDSTSLSLSLKLLHHCSLLNADVSTQIASLFSMPVLSRIDSLVENGMLDRDSTQYLLFLLNQEACLRYPELGVPWMFGTEETTKFTNKDAELKTCLPGDLSDLMDECMDDGDGMVGKDIILDFGVPLWRAMLLNKEDKPVKFTTENLSHADQLGYKKIVFVHDTTRWLQKRYNEYYSKLGWKIIEIDPVEWNSISVASPECKLAFITEKILLGRSSTDSSFTKRLHVVNTNNLSEQWLRALEYSDIQLTARQ